MPFWLRLPGTLTGNVRRWLRARHGGGKLPDGRHQGWTQTQSVTLASAARSSAEVIAEAPGCTANSGILPLTNFGTASFASATANGQSLATFRPTEIVMPNTSMSAINAAGASR